MLTALLLTAPLLEAKLPSAWAGIWATPQGVAVTVTERGMVQTMVGDRHAFGYGLAQVPNGSYLGQWGGSARCRNAVSRTETALVTTLYGMAGTDWPLPMDSRTVADYGQLRITPGVVDAYGRMSTLNLDLRDGNGALKMTGPLTPALTLDAISVGGRFDDGTLRAELSDDRGAISGTLTFNRASYILKGARHATRAHFSLTEGSTGRVVGRGYVMWTPSPARVLAFRQGQRQTDQVIVGAEMPGFPTGTSRTLPRKD
jgi:hypothetical protein